MRRRTPNGTGTETRVATWRGAGRPLSLACVAVALCGLVGCSALVDLDGLRTSPRGRGGEGATGGGGSSTGGAAAGGGHGGGGGGVSQTSVLASNLASPRGIAVDVDHVYWGDIAEQAIYRVAKVGGPPELVAKDRVGTPGGLYVDNNRVYWSNQDELEACGPFIASQLKSDLAAAPSWVFGNCGFAGMVRSLPSGADERGPSAFESLRWFEPLT